MPRPKDETYIIDLCDGILGLKASRGHRFDFLLGDLNKRNYKAKLPVDAYYAALNLVIEYHERQHSQAVPFFDKKIVASGMTRGEQRRRYDRRRKETLPENGIDLIEFSYKEFGHNASKRLSRTPNDRDIVRQKLAGLLKAKNFA